MDERRIAASNQRRRRVLKDEPAPPDGDVTEAPVTRRARAGSRGTRTYSESALAENQPRITDLIPHRRWVQVATLGVLILAIAGLGAVQAALPEWQTRVGVEAATLMNPDSPGSLSRWLSSAMLGWAGILSLIVYSLRRHKTDDYHAGYRIWSLVALALFAASMMTSTGVHHLVFDSVQIVAEYLAPGTSLAKYARQLCWAGMGILGLIFLAKLAMEIASSRPSLIALLSGATIYFVSAIVPGTWKSPVGTNYVSVFSTSLRLVGDLSILLSIMVYGRHVYLEAQGLLPRPARPKKKSKEQRGVASDESDSSSETSRESEGDKAEAASVTSKRSDLDPVLQPKSAGATAAAKGTGTAPTAVPSSTNFGRETAANATARKPVLSVKPAATTPAAAARDQDDDEAESEDDDSGLTRAERRRLKKLAKRDNRNAA